MKKEQFYNLLENPLEVSTKDLKELSKILEGHPYFSSARILVTKANLSKKTVGLGEEIISHGSLYPNTLILEDWFEEINPKVEVIVKTDDGSQRIKDVAKEIIGLLPDPIGDEIDPLFEKIRKEKAESLAQKNEVKEVKGIVEKVQSNGPTEIKESVKASTASPKSEAPKPEVKTEIQTPKEKLETSPKKDAQPAAQEISSESGNIADEVMKNLMELRKSREDANSNSSAEKIPVENEKVPSSRKKELKKAKEKEKKEHKSSKKKSNKEGKPSKKLNEEREKKLSHQRDLIKDFIQNPPELKKDLKSEDGPIADLALPSGQENRFLVSESLAKILLRQGKLEKAKDVYEQLMLKYPEKKSYFAAQIKSLSE